MMEDVRDARHILRDIVPEVPRIDYFLNLLEHHKKELARLDELTRVYDKIGLLVKHRAVPLSFVGNGKLNS